MVRCTSCGQEFDADDKFCGWCGAPRPAVAEEPGVEPIAAGHLDPRFERAQRSYYSLKAKLDRGRITRDEFGTALQELMLQDAQGRYWMLGADSGQWYVHDGQAWVQADPSPSEARPATRPGAQEVSPAYGAEAVAVAQPAPVAPAAVGHRFAGFWRRLGAYLVDAVLLWVLNYVLLLPFGEDIQLAATGFLEPESAVSMAILVAFGLLALIAVAYCLVFWTWRGQTPGKMLLGIKIVRIDGSPLTFGRAILRLFMGYPISGMVFGLGFLWIGLDSRKQGWHDKIAGTYVVRA